MPRTYSTMSGILWSCTNDYKTSAWALPRLDLIDEKLAARDIVKTTAILALQTEILEVRIAIKVKNIGGRPLRLDARTLARVNDAYEGYRKEFKKQEEERNRMWKVKWATRKQERKMICCGNHPMEDVERGRGNTEDEVGHKVKREK